MAPKPSASASCPAIWTFPLILLFLGLGGPSWAADEASDAAAALRQAHAARQADAVERLSQRDDPDPWLVAEALLAAGHADAAAEIPKRAPRKDVASLLAYIERRSTRRGAANQDAAVGRALGLLREDPAGALAALAEAATDTEDVAAVRVLYVRGRALQALQKNEEAQRTLTACAEAAAKLGWLARACQASEQASRSAFRRARFDEALSLAQRWRAVEKSLGSTQGEARARCLEALVQLRRGALDDAARLSKEAKETLEPLKDHAYVALAQSNLGYIQFARGQLAEGRALYLQAIAELEKEPPPTGVARFRRDAKADDRTRISLLISAAAYTYYLGDPDEAWKQLEAASGQAQEAGIPELRARALLTAGGLREAAGELLEALASFEPAVGAYEEAGDPAGRAKVLRRMGNVRRRLGDHPEARKNLNEAAEILEAAGDTREAALTRFGLGLTFEREGEPEKAVEAYRVGGVLASRLGKTPLAVKALEHTGDAYLMMGRYGQALDHHEQALARHRALQKEGASNADGVIGSLRSVAHVHTVLGDPETALAHSEEALDLLDQTRDLQLRASVMLNHARALIAAGTDAEEVGPLLQSSFAHYEKARDRHGSAKALITAVQQARAHGKFEDAIRQCDQLATVYAALRDQIGLAMAQMNKALALQALGRSDEALTVLQNAVAAAEKAASVDALISCHWGLAQLHLVRKEYEATIAACRRASTSLRELGRHLAEGQGASARSQFAPLFDVAVTAAARLGDEEGVHGFLEEGRSATLLAALGGRESLRAAVIPEGLREEESAARAAEALARARVQQAARSGKLREMRKRRDAWNTATDRVRTVIEKIQRVASAQAELVYPSVNTLAETQATLAADDALVLYALTGQEALALVVTQKTARVVSLGSRAAVEAVCGDLLLDERPYVDEAQIGAARKALVTPLALPASVKRVLVGPDGALAYVPMVLLLPDHEIAYVPSASVLAHLTRQAASGGTKILALGDPVYAGSASSADGTRGARGSQLARLPASGDEAKAVGDTVLLRGEASETGLRAVLAKGARWRAVHLACHGLIDTENPTLSSLALSADAENDGFLTALDVFRLRIPADLAVLSACETGKGRAVRGEGIIGLTRAFLFAGSPRVVCSLWKVDDAATNALMVKFYELWNPPAKPGDPALVEGPNAGLGAAEALRKAQAHIRAQEKWKHPYFWSAWVLWGLPN